MPRVACLQWTPTFMDPDASRARADALLAARCGARAGRGRGERRPQRRGLIRDAGRGLRPDDVDVLLLPEMAFAGLS
jgi:hypothetical protein